MLNRESFACAPWFPPNQTNAKPGLSSVRSYVEDVGGGNESWTLGESWERYPSRSGIHYCCKFNASWKPGSDTRLAPRFGYVANVTGRKAGTDIRLAPGFTIVANSMLVGNLGAILVSLQIYAYVANMTGRKPGSDTHFAPRFGYIANVTRRKPGSDTRLAPRFGYVANVTGRKPGSDTRLAPRFRVYTSVNTATIRCISGNLELYCAFDWEFWRSARVVKKLWGADLRIYTCLLYTSD